MTDLREACSSRWGWHGFIAQTECIKRAMGKSNNPEFLPTNPYIELYTMEADKLVDDVRNKRISEAGAGLELQRVYLDGKRVAQAH